MPTIADPQKTKPYLFQGLLGATPDGSDETVGPESTAGGGAYGRAITAAGPGIANGYRPLARGMTRGGAAVPAVAAPTVATAPMTAAAATMPATMNSVMPNATAGQAQARAVDNTLPMATRVGPTVAVQPAAAPPVPQDVQFMQSTNPGIAQNIRDPANGPAYGSTQTIAPTSMANISPEIARELYGAKMAAARRGDFESIQGTPGYRGPQANGVAYGTPGPGNPLEAELAFAARSRDPNERAKIPGLIAVLGDQRSVERNDAGFKMANEATTVNATAGLQGAQAAEIAALTPSRVGLNKAQSAEALGRTSKSLADTSKTLLEGSEIAGAGPERVKQAQQQTETNAIALKSAKELEQLRTKALTSGKPEDMERYSQAERARAGKGGNLTDEDIAKLHNELIVAHVKAFANMPNAPEAITLPEYRAQLKGIKLPIDQNPRAQAIRAEVESGTMKADEAKRRLAALGYSS